MRADAHYVDALSTPARGDRAARDHGRAAPAADTAPSAALERRVLDQLMEEIAAIESAAATLAGDASPLARRVGLDLIKAQASRASWMLGATAMMAGADADAPVRRRPLAAVLAHVQERAGVECRLVGISLDVDAGEAGGAIVPADLAVGITGLVIAQLGLLSGAEHGVIRISATSVQAELVALEVVQDLAPLSANAHARFFELGWTARPGGWLAALGAATAKAAAERLGGRIAVVSADRRGCAIQWTWPSVGIDPQ